MASAIPAATYEGPDAYYSPILRYLVVQCSKSRASPAGLLSTLGCNRGADAQAGARTSPTCMPAAASYKQRGLQHSNPEGIDKVNQFDQHLLYGPGQALGAIFAVAELAFQPAILQTA